uniref:ATP synthase complex subunit 8 n=1 Tax=Nola angustipennis TaxID=3003639 RepID=A0A9E9BZD9_9NEOP|nr:ATP synthase F0 subunit 8 [Nola angustipennis]WAL04251.1 ATP synthase F0 subunit 8 [Nola angustipennis]
MPQMMPINWMLSFMFFLIMFLLFNIMNYYIFYNIKQKNNTNNFKMKNFNWKW